MRCAPVTLATTVAATEPIGNTFRRLGEPQTRSFASPAAGKATFSGAPIGFLRRRARRRRRTHAGQCAATDTQSPLAPNRLRAVIWQEGQLIDLGVAPGFFDSRGRGINNRGQVIGTVEGGLPTSGFLVGRRRDDTIAKARSRDNQRTLSINDVGEIVGITLTRLAAAVSAESSADVSSAPATGHRRPASVATIPQSRPMRQPVGSPTLH
jgi:hypothetical protein